MGFTVLIKDINDNGTKICKHQVPINLHNLQLTTQPGLEVHHGEPSLNITDHKNCGGSLPATIHVLQFGRVSALVDRSRLRICVRLQKKAFLLLTWLYVAAVQCTEHSVWVCLPIGFMKYCTLWHGTLFALTLFLHNALQIGAHDVPERISQEWLIETIAEPSVEWLLWVPGCESFGCNGSFCDWGLFLA